VQLGSAQDRCFDVQLASVRSPIRPQPPPNQPPSGDVEAAFAALDMDHYDSSDDPASDGGSDDDDEDGGGARASAVVVRALGGRVAEGIVLDDPYYQRGDSEDDDDDDAMSGSEREDYIIRPDDLLILAASNEDEVSTLGVWVYEEAGPATGEGGGGEGVGFDCALPAFLERW